MVSLIRNKAKKYSSLLWVIAVIIVVLISYGQTLRMYFWQDDFALLFKLQHLEAPAGSFGSGIIGSGPYKYLISFFVPFFPLFKLNAFPYFLVGFLSYLLVTLVFYLFASEIFSDKKAGYFATLIFAAGYVGSEIMFRIANSWQTNLGLILAVSSFIFYLKYCRDNTRRYLYLISFGLYLAAVEFVFVRSHALVMAYIFFDLFANRKKLSFKNLILLAVRQIPFLLVFYLRYIKGETMGSAGLIVIIKDILAGKFQVLASFFATMGNSFFPDVLQGKFISLVHIRLNFCYLLFFLIISWISLSFFKAGKKLKFSAAFLMVLAYLINKSFIAKGMYWYRSYDAYLSGATGFCFLILFLAIAFSLFPRAKRLAQAIIIGLVILSSQIFSYYIKYPDAIFSTTHRYLSYSLIGYSLLWGSVAYAFFQRLKKRNLIPYFVLGGILLINLGLGFKYQKNLVEVRSKPTRDFYLKLQSYVPAIKKGALFYFDIKNEPLYRQQFYNFFSVGSMPDSTAIAVFYGVDRYDLSLFTDQNELLQNIRDNKTNIGHLYSFYYDENGLNDMTQRTREVLAIPSKNSNLADIDKIFPFMPLSLSFQAKIIPDITNIVYPYSFVNKKTPLFSKNKRYLMLDYLNSRSEYYRNVKTKSLSQWKYQELTYLTDNNLETSWRGHRIYWNDNEHEQVFLDLGQVRSVGKLIWVNWNHTLTPTKYTLEVSNDEKNWEVIKKVTDGPERKDGEMVVEDFPAEYVRFIKMDITATTSNDAPAISELEIVDEKYKDVNIPEAFEYIKEPFYYIEDNKDMEKTIGKVGPLLNIVVTEITDKGTGIKKIPVIGFNQTRTFNATLDVGGTRLKDIKVEIPNAPVKIETDSMFARNMDIYEIERKKMINDTVNN